MADLPIHAVLPDLLAALRAGSNAVLVAPPGAGKTTAVAPVLLGEPWCTGEILLLSPRRLAARAAAERMAELAGEPVGGTIGYATRLDSKRSAKTRITVLTEGIFLKRIQADPELAGVSAVLFDEVHERSLDSDFGLALALDAQAALRPDLRLVTMSATLDGARFGALMAKEDKQPAPVIESAGRAFPIELVHLGRATERRIEDEMAPVIRRALAEGAGSLLAFLPGVAEIERTAERLGDLPAGVDLHRLHGSLDPRDQRAAIAPSPSGRRKVVLATSIAETSLTLDGVRIVIDSGLARRPRYDRAAGLTRLVTERASQAAVTQRAGRAGRQGPGRVYRLWEEAATQALPRFDPPEILEADLSALLLDCALWGVADPRSLRWLDPPPAAAIDEARRRLTILGALDEAGRPTAHGRAIAELPLPPRLAHMLIEAEARGRGATAAEVAVLLSERGLGGQEADLELRLRRWRGEKGKRAEAARGLAKRWRSLLRAPAKAGALADPPATLLLPPEHDVGACVALAFPDRLAKRRDSTGADWLSVGGRGFRLDPASPLAREAWLAVAEVGGAAAGARILSAAPIDQALVETLFADRIELRRSVSFDPASGSVQALRERRLGNVRLGGGPDSDVAPAEVEQALLEGVRNHGLSLLPWTSGIMNMRARSAFAAVHGGQPDPWSDEALLARLDDWLPPLLEGKRRLDAIDESDFWHELDGLPDYRFRSMMGVVAPAIFTAPTDSTYLIDYGAEDDHGS